MYMVNINRQMMLEGMRADFHKVDHLSQKVIEIVRTAKEVRATTKGGSNFVATLNPEYKWIKTSGLISPDKWGNLPGGEVFTTPGSVDGMLVIDGVVGDFLCEKFGSLADSPLTLRVKDNRLVEAHSENKELESDFWNYTHTDENSDRVGEFAIGTNIRLKQVIGHILQDEKFPGISSAFGDPPTRPHRRQWSRPRTSTWWRRVFDIWVDGRQIMSDGKFLIRVSDLALRSAFNQRWTDAQFRDLVARLETRTGAARLRSSETPVSCRDR